MRLNRAIAALERGGVALGGGLIQPRHVDGVIASAELGYDFLVLETEHMGFDTEAISTSMQFLLVPGEARPIVSPFVRVPAYGSEVAYNGWFVKQALDQGAFGLVFPSIETVEQARAAVAAARYPQPTGTTYPEPVGRRGYWPMNAARYWGLSMPDYLAKADIWPVNPEGEILLTVIIETTLGVENLPGILREVAGIGAVWPGRGDYAVASGASGNSADPRVQQAMLRIFECCNEYGVACVGSASSAEDAERRIDEGYRIIFSRATLTDPAASRAREILSK